MDTIKSLLTKKISKSNVKIWQLLALASLVWISPILLPEFVWENYGIYILLGWGLLYVLLSRVILATLRLTSHDAILIERFFILVSFLVPLAYGIFYGFRNGFDTFLMVCLGFGAIISAMLIVGIAIHIKSAGKYYHGVSKDELFK